MSLHKPIYRCISSHTLLNYKVMAVIFNFPHLGDVAGDSHEPESNLADNFGPLLGVGREWGTDSIHTYIHTYIQIGFRVQEA